MSWNQQDLSFKTLLNKRVTADSKKFYEEIGDDTINSHVDQLWTDTISSTPSQAVIDGAAEQYSLFELTEDTSVANQRCYYAFAIVRLESWISDKFGLDYSIRLFQNDGSEIFATDASQWLFNYQTGILIFNGSTTSFSKPFKISGYRYIGGKGISGIQNGMSGFSGGSSGYSGYSGTGSSGYSGYSGAGTSGYSGYAGTGISGYSGRSGYSGSGISGYSGSGISGYSGRSGYSGAGGSVSGVSGYISMFNATTSQVNSPIFVNNFISNGGSGFVTIPNQVLSATLDKTSLLSVDQMQLSQLNGGAYFGRTNITENHFNVDEISNTLATNWIKSFESSAETFKSIAISSDGRYQSTCTGAKNYVSIDYGTTWVTRVSSGGGLIYTGSSTMSADGRVQADMTTTGLAISTNWNAYANRFAAFTNGYAVAMSDDGSIITATTQGITPGSTQGYVYVSYDFGATWTQKTGLGYWNYVAMSSDGKYQMAGQYDGSRVYRSPDYGITWSQVSGTYTGRCNGLAMSSDGRYQTAVLSSSYICTSADYGATFNQVATSAADVTSITMSASGRIQVLIGSSSMRLSTNYGLSFTFKGVINGLGVDITSDGRMIVCAASAPNNAVMTSCTTSSIRGTVSISNIGQSNKRSLLSVDQMELSQLDGGSYFGPTGIKESEWNLSDIGLIWVQNSAASKAWADLAMSSDGKYQTGVCASEYIYTSSDYGVTWTQITAAGSKNWCAVKMSSDGKIQVACVNTSGEYAYISYNYGASWSTLYLGPFVCCAMSSDGRVITTGQGGLSNWVYVSYDFGTTWSSYKPPATTQDWYWKDIAMSSDGRIQTAATNYLGGYIWVSYDYGKNWNQKATVLDWKAVAMSADGKYQTAVVNNAPTTGGYIWVSSDYGNTWASKDSMRIWNHIAMSSEGRTQMAIMSTGDTYVSIDYGQTWSLKGTNGNSTCTMSSDGKTLLTASNTGYMYVSYAKSNTQGSAKVTSGDVIISDWTKGIIFKDNQSPAHYWRLAIASTGGTVTTTDLGTSPP